MKALKNKLIFLILFVLLTDTIPLINFPIDCVYAKSKKPVAVADSAIVSIPEQPYIDIPVLNNDTYVGTPNISITSNPKNGTAAVVENKIRYTPNGDVIGKDNFKYKITDVNGSSAKVNVKVTVNGPDPVAIDDSASMIRPTESNVIINALENDTGYGLKVKSISSAPSNGTASITNRNLSIKYTPASGFVGIDTFTYTAKDSLGRITSPANVTVTVDVDGSAFAAYNDEVYMSVPGQTDVAINVLDNDTGYNLAVTKVGNPGHGSAVTNGTTVTYTPASGYTGTDFFSYTIKQNGKGAGKNAAITVNITQTSSGPLRTAVYKTVQDSYNDLNDDLNSSDYNNPNALPGVMFGLYYQVFLYLSDSSVDTGTELNSNERNILQNDLRDKFIELYNKRIEIEKFTSPNILKTNEFNTLKNSLRSDLNNWMLNNSSDASN